MIQIAVLTNGFVYVGDVQPINKGVIVILNAWNIRRWGTSRGLGEIAVEGPTKNTILDRAGIVRVPNHSLIFLLDCEAKQWQRVLD